MSETKSAPMPRPFDLDEFMETQRKWVTETEHQRAADAAQARAEYDEHQRAAAVVSAGALARAAAATMEADVAAARAARALVVAEQEASKTASAAEQKREEYIRAVAAAAALPALDDVLAVDDAETTEEPTRP